MTDKADPMMEPAARGLDLAGNPLPPADKAPNQPMGHSPVRRPGSLRRTMSIDIDWPEDGAVPARFRGRARDIVTPADGGDPVLLAEDAVTGLLDERRITALESAPPRTAIAALVGERAGANLRTALDRVLGEEKRTGTPLYLLLDDLAGASLVCRWAWARWNRDFMEEYRQENMAEHIARMEGVCIGFRPGSSALDFDDRPAGMAPNSAQVLSLVNPADPAGWHALPPDEPAPRFRRARLIDIWREDELIHVWSVFQDSSNQPGSDQREAIHEYRLSATADARTGTLLTLDATPGTLPHAECPAAIVNIGVLLNSPMTGLRETVLEKLRRTAGCTHLNDMIRSLAEAPILASRLSVSAG